MLNIRLLLPSLASQHKGGHSLTSFASESYGGRDGNKLILPLPRYKNNKISAYSFFMGGSFSLGRKTNKYKSIDDDLVITLKNYL